MSDFILAYNANPSVELVDQQCREAYEKKLYHSAMLYGQMALELRKRSQQDHLPGSTDLYTILSVSGYYTGDYYYQIVAEQCAEALATHKSVSPKYRNLAQRNQLYYCRNLMDLVGPYHQVQLKYQFDYYPNNPSVLNWHGNLWMVQRTVNYKIDAVGRYSTGVNDPIITQNYLMRLDHNLNVINTKPITPPVNWPEAVYTLVQGFEDCRLFVVKDQLFCTSTVREQNKNGLCEVFLSELDPQTGNMRWAKKLNCHEPHLHQKNWMPFDSGDSFRFLYSCDPTVIIDDQGSIIHENICSISGDNFRGGGQVIEYRHGYLAIIHESVILENSLRNYVHRFVLLDKHYQIVGISSRFKFLGARIEFAAGICWHPDNKTIIVSFGINDCESWILTIDPKQIDSIIRPMPAAGGRNLPCGPAV